MRVVVCPDKFAGTLSAPQAAQAIRDGWLRARPADEVRCIPLADGGPGFVEVLHANLGGTLHEITVGDPLGRDVGAQWLQVGDVAYIEAAQANGLARLEPDERDPWRASTAGVGQLIEAARGCERIIVGLGGSATNDGGRGAVEALGGPVPGLILATDVDSPLLGPDGATYMFAAQKGAATADLPGLEERMRLWAAQDPQLAQAPGAGAAGGLGFGLMLLGGVRVSGFEVVAQAVGLAAACAGADVVITGEGKFDRQSLHGKVVSGVRAMAPRLIVLAGQVTVAEPGVEAHGLLDFAGDRAFTEPAQALADLAQQVAQSWQ